MRPANGLLWGADRSGCSLSPDFRGPGRQGGIWSACKGRAGKVGHGKFAVLENRYRRAAPVNIGPAPGRCKT